MGAVPGQPRVLVTYDDIANHRFFPARDPKRDREKEVSVSPT